MKILDLSQRDDYSYSNGNKNKIEDRALSNESNKIKLLMDATTCP